MASCLSWRGGCFGGDMKNEQGLHGRLVCELGEVSSSDWAAVAEHLGGESAARRTGLLALLEDPEERLDLLDHEPVRQAVRELRGTIADLLGCYVDVRTRLEAVGIGNRKLALYLANIWAGYRETGLLPDMKAGDTPLLETVDILRELNFVEGYDKFELLALSGNYYLFLMAFFEGYFREMDDLSGKPAMAYYEAFARIAFRAARDHGLCGEFELEEVYTELSEHFGEVRAALSGLV